MCGSAHQIVEHSVYEITLSDISKVKMVGKRPLCAKGNGPLFIAESFLIRRNSYTVGIFQGIKKSVSNLNHSDFCSALASQT